MTVPGWTTTGAFTVVPYGGGGSPDFFTFPPESEGQRRKMRRSLVVAVAALVVPAVALASGWRIIGQGKASGKYTVAAASGTAIKPAAIRLKVTASPNIRTVGGYSIQCRKGAKKKKGTGKANGLTPVTKAVVLPIASPDSCVVVASATLGSTTKMTVTILSRR